MSSRTATRLAWSLWTLCAVLIALSLLFDFLTYSPMQPENRWRPVMAVLSGVSSLAYPTVGALVISRLPANPIGWIFCGAGLLYGVRRCLLVYTDYAIFEPKAPGGTYTAWVLACLGFSGLILLGTLLVLLFPDGRLPSRRLRIVAWVAAGGFALFTFSEAFTPGPLPDNAYVYNPFGIEGIIGGAFTTDQLFKLAHIVGGLLLLAGCLASLASPLLRLHRARGDERQQLKWFLYAAVPAVAGLIGVLLPDLVKNITVDAPYRVGQVTGYTEYPIYPVAVLFPIVTGIAILKYRLWDIDVLINRTLVYGALTACVVGLYVLVVGGLGALLQARDNALVSLFAAGVVAVVFAPLRDRLQRGVNRLMYGERDDPYRVLSRLGQRLEAALAPDVALDTVVQTIAQALKLPYAEISLKQGDEFVTAARYGDPTAETVTLPLTHGAESVGRLILAPRAPGEEFSSSDRRLLEDLARQAGVAAHAARLTADLQRSRERLVTAREEERRRLRRDLHDGLGPQLAAQTLKVGSARSLYSRDPVAADALLSELEADMEAAISNIRRLVYNLRPPALDELGLDGAIRESAAQYATNGLKISVDAPKTLPSLPAAVEVAAYRIVQEALTNVVRHAGASACAVRLRLGSKLKLEITDDGVGLPEDRGAGVGLSSMRERAVELGGTCVVGPSLPHGTRVLARLPLPHAELVEGTADQGRDGQRRDATGDRPPSAERPVEGRE